LKRKTGIKIASIMLLGALVLPMATADAASFTVKTGRQWYEINWSNDVATMHFTVFYHNNRSQALQVRCEFVAMKNVYDDPIAYKWVTVGLKAHQSKTEVLKMKLPVESINDQSFHVYKNGCWRVWA
jgi:hypothetical protein